MFLFIHGTGATNSLWLSNIRNILNLDSQYSDHLLLSMFTIQLPGHPKNDEDFASKDINKKIDEFVLKNRSKQADLAKDFVLGNSPGVIRTLKEPQLTIIGHSLGGFLAMNYANHNPDQVLRLILCSFGYKFSFWSRVGIWSLNKFSKLSPEQIKKLKYKKLKTRDRVLLDNIAENPNKKGLKSAFKIVREYDFGSYSKFLSQFDKYKLTRIKVLAFGGGLDPITRPSSIRRLQKEWNQIYQSCSQKETVIKANKLDERTEPPFIYKIYSGLGHNFMDSKKSRFNQDVRNFLNL